MALVHVPRATCRDKLPARRQAIAIESKQPAAHIQTTYHIASFMRFNIEAQYWYGKLLKP